MSPRWFAQPLALFALASSSCLGTNPDPYDLETELARYPDLGRTAIDPVIAGVLTLTFDDGPRQGSTESILGTLDAFNVKATFLMVGKMADSYPAVARSVADHGHSIGSHTYGHLNLAKASQEEAMADVTAQP